jgi:nucleoid DNA-binding protein
MAKATPKAPTKTEVLNSISESCGMNKKDVAKVIDALSEEIKKNLGTAGPGVFAIPGLVKIERKDIEAKPARIGVPDPFHKGQLRDYPAKPASVKIKIRALKNLKEMVAPPQ